MNDKWFIYVCICNFNLLIYKFDIDILWGYQINIMVYDFVSNSNSSSICSNKHQRGILSSISFDIKEIICSINVVFLEFLCK